MDSSVQKIVTGLKDKTLSEGDTCQQASVAGQTEVNPEVPCHTPHTPNQTTAQRQTGETPNTVQCVQGNLRWSHQALVNIFLDLLNKNIYKNGSNVIFLTEPPQITKANALADVPDDIFKVFTEKYG